MIYIRKDDLEIIIEHARTEYPLEACGILAGKSTTHVDRMVEKVYRMTNSDASAVTYIMDSAEQYKVMKEMRERGFELIGIYHSHTSSAAYPSKRDIDLASYPEASYMIVSLALEEPYIKSFKIEDGRVEEEEIKIL